MKYIEAKSIVSGYAEDNRWFGVNYNMNIYRGCCHGCIYCDSRSSCYGIEDFDSVRAKADALPIIARELSSKRRKGVVGTGAMSDPYNPFERELRLTRNALELIDSNGFGAAIATKGALVARGADVLGHIATHSPVLIKLTVTTADDALAAKLEPHAPPPSERFAAIAALSAKGLYSGVLMMPVLPYIEDNAENVLQIVDRAADAGAKFIYPAFGMTLRQNQRDYYYAKLDELFPGLTGKYKTQYGRAYSCVSTAAKRLWAQFSQRCRERRIVYRMDSIIDGYKAPYRAEQLSFLDF